MYQLTQRLRKLEGKLPVSSDDPFGDAINFAWNRLSAEGFDRLVQVAFREVPDSDLHLLLDYCGAEDLGERFNQTHRVDLSRLAAMVASAARELQPSGFARLHGQGGM